ncbi:MAG: 3-methyl-2-oxobutanoate hydroxymethyltransferase [Nitrospiraceae bacterium]|nr:3-methyl-2-oxobutanoate hydroxymethyltransferase [Nitrospiraceae bacterium]
MPKTTILDIYKKKAEGKKITMLTAYDYPFAQIVDQAGIDMILVGDSLGNVVQGVANTLPVTMDEMIYHTKMVSRAVQSGMVVGDMPFLSYQTGSRDAILNAGRFLKEAGADCVKLEGGSQMAPVIRAIVDAGIPVVAHIGLTPQYIHMLGGFKVQGKDEAAREKLLADAHAVQDAGAFSVVIEAVPASLGKEITAALRIPTIGIGAGPDCDGQVLVIHDLLGLFDRFTPKFVKRYANLKEQALSAVQQYKKEVESEAFPGPEHSFK